MLQKKERAILPTGAHEEIEISQILHTEKPIIKCADQDVLAQLRYVYVLCGLRQEKWPSKVEIPFLLENIRKQFGKFRPGEIRIAFEMAAAGKLDVDLNLYSDTFSFAKFAEIMNAYVTRARQEVVFRANQYANIKKEPSEQEKIAVIREFMKIKIMPIVKNVKDGHPIDIGLLNPWRVYRYFKDAGLIDQEDIAKAPEMLKQEKVRIKKEWDEIAARPSETPEQYAEKKAVRAARENADETLHEQAVNKVKIKMVENAINRHEYNDIYTTLCRDKQEK